MNRCLRFDSLLFVGRIRCAVGWWLMQEGGFDLRTADSQRPDGLRGFRRVGAKLQH